MHCLALDCVVPTPKDKVARVVIADLRVPGVEITRHATWFHANSKAKSYGAFQ